MTKEDVDVLFRLLARSYGCRFCIVDGYGHPEFCALWPEIETAHMAEVCRRVKQENGKPCAQCDNQLVEQYGKSGKRTFCKRCPAGVLEVVTIARSPGGKVLALFAGLFRAGGPLPTGSLVYPERGAKVELPEISDTDLRELMAGMDLLGRGVTEVLAAGGGAGGNSPEEVVRAYVDGKFRNDISLGQVAAKLGWSPAYAATQIRKMFGKTLSELINERRVENAKWLLRNKYMPAVMIGRFSGYRSPAQFHRVFHRLVGMTPMEFKKSGK